LICDGFGIYETLEIIEFCFESNIAPFALLKAVYRNQVNRLERGGINTIDKEHFTALYSPARKVAFTPRNIKAGFAISGLFLFNPDRVLRSMPAPLAKPAIPRVEEVKVGSRRQDVVVIYYKDK
jgi:hypothetical protein